MISHKNLIAKAGGDQEMKDRCDSIEEQTKIVPGDLACSEPAWAPRRPWERAELLARRRCCRGDEDLSTRRRCCQRADEKAGGGPSLEVRYDESGSGDKSLDASPSEEEEQNHSKAQVLPARCRAVLELGGAVRARVDWPRRSTTSKSTGISTTDRRGGEGAATEASIESENTRKAAHELYLMNQRAINSLLGQQSSSEPSHKSPRPGPQWTDMAKGMEVIIETTRTMMIGATPIARGMSVVSLNCLMFFYVSVIYSVPSAWFLKLV